MLKHSPKKIGETVKIAIAFDPTDRTIEAHPKLVKALEESPAAKKVFDSLPASRQKEIVRYISFLKTEGSIDKNVSRAINFLLGKDRFIGRDHP
ncbi:MAG TPA: YdeI/OmpD-associated family protein [Flavisolibacter sp.]|nr:YdeI/OmpD-associated family protein [Flavisolibacter sp.]